MLVSLLGLAVDYELFIVSRMREVYAHTGNPSTAVIEGIGRTGRHYLLGDARAAVYTVCRFGKTACVGSGSRRAA